MKHQYSSSALARNPAAPFNSFLSSLILSSHQTSFHSSRNSSSLFRPLFKSFPSLWCPLLLPLPGEDLSSFKTYCILSKTLASSPSQIDPCPEPHNTISSGPFPWLSFGAVCGFSCLSTGCEVAGSHPCSFPNAPQPREQHSVHSRHSINSG